MKRLILFLFLLMMTGCSSNLKGYAWNDVQTINQGGVQIQIARVSVYEKSSLPKDEQNNLNQKSAFSDTPTICNLYFRITNTTNAVMSVYPDQGLLMANDEQVQLVSYSLFSDGFSGGQIFPGATVSGYAAFGLKKVTPEAINNMKIKINAPHDELFRSYGADYLFSLDLSKHQWADKPNDLK